MVAEKSSRVAMGDESNKLYEYYSVGAFPQFCKKWTLYSDKTFRFSSSRYKSSASSEISLTESEFNALRRIFRSVIVSVKSDKRIRPTDVGGYGVIDYKHDERYGCWEYAFDQEKLGKLKSKIREYENDVYYAIFGRNRWER